MWSFRTSRWANTGLAAKASASRQESSSRTFTAKKTACQGVVQGPLDQAPEQSARPKGVGASPKAQQPAVGTDPASLASRKVAQYAANLSIPHARGTAATAATKQRRRRPAKEHPRGSDNPRPISTNSSATPSPAIPPAPPTAPLGGDALRLAALDPDHLIEMLKKGPYSPMSVRTGSPHHHMGRADTDTGKLTHVTPPLLLATCRELRKRLLLDRSFQLTHIVEVIEALAAYYGDREEGGGAQEEEKGATAARVASELLQRHHGCRQALLVAQRSPEQAELARLLPRLVPALVALEFDDKDVWEKIFRVMHSNLDCYKGDDVAALVPALVELDSVMTYDGSTSSAGGLSGGSSSSSTSSTGFGSRQLMQPAMSHRLQALASDGGVSGDATAGLLLWLVASSLQSVGMDQVTAFIRRAMLRTDLSPQGYCRLLKATAWLGDRLAGGATEVTDLLRRHDEGLLQRLTRQLAELATAGRLRPQDFTDAAQSLTQLRFLEPNFMAELAASTARGIRAGQVKRRDITVALYASAFFGSCEHATADLFVAAAASLEPRLGSDALKPVILTRLAWSYAVAGGCGILSEQGRDRATVERFVKRLAEVLHSRVADLLRGAEVWGQLRYALQIWSATQPSLLTPALLEAAGLEHLHPRGQQQQQSPQGRKRGKQLLQQEESSSAPSPNRAAVAAAAVPVNPCVSGLQRDVYQRLEQLGYRPKMEARVGAWTVDILLRLDSPQHQHLQVAVEVDGPTHFTTSREPQPLGTSLVRDACLRRLGLAVVTIDFREYEGCSSPERRTALLRARVEAAMRLAAEGR